MPHHQKRNSFIHNAHIPSPILFFITIFQHCDIFLEIKDKNILKRLILSLNARKISVYSLLKIKTKPASRIGFY